MPDEAIVEISSGRIRGRRTASGGFEFLGIPYGRDTSGTARFQPPQPAGPWAGIREATSFGPNCPQGLPTLPESDAASIRGLGLPSSEDCLCLNVWTPTLLPARGRPVMVWFHPGGFRVGSGAHPVTNGANLSAHGDAVVITVNHRLGVFGYLFLDDIAGGQLSETANCGLLDLILSLQWVRDNAAAFGGDPDNVTIFGQSGGGRKVCVLMGMPAAAGLFHRAIIESGPHPRGVPRERATRFSAGFVKHLGIAGSEIRKLQALPADDLYRQIVGYSAIVRDPQIATTAEVAGWMVSPVVDGESLPADPWGLAAPELSRHVPLIIGTNKDEAALRLARSPDAGQLTERQLRALCREVLGDHADAVIATHRGSRPGDTPWELMAAIASEDRRMMSIDIAQKKAAQGGAPAFMYFFTWESNEGFYRAAHEMEIPFVFRNLDAPSMIGTRPDRHQLADVVSDSWLAFARSGNPSHPGLPPWAPYTAERRETMMLDVPPRLEPDPWKAEREVWDGDAACLPWEEASFVAMLSAR